MNRRPYTMLSEDFSTSHSINVAGPYFTTIAFAPLLTKSGNASVIIIASIAPFVQQKSVGPITYSVSKGGGELRSTQLSLGMRRTTETVEFHILSFSSRHLVSSVGLSPDPVSPRHSRGNIAHS
jgi:NAD(P)-dependent dehydrogenase (short-subunit alcohol dehydrogenase family)